MVKLFFFFTESVLYTTMTTIKLSFFLKGGGGGVGRTVATQKEQIDNSSASIVSSRVQRNIKCDITCRVQREDSPDAATRLGRKVLGTRLHDNSSVDTRFVLTQGYAKNVSF